jgi:hypothetical protein
MTFPAGPGIPGGTSSGVLRAAAAAPLLPLLRCRQMADTPLPLRPRSATEIIDAAFQLYRRDALSYLLVSALCYAPLLVLQLVILGPATQLSPEMMRLTMSYTLVLAFGYWISMSLMSAVIVRLSSEDYFGRRLEPAVAVRDAVRRLPSVMLGLLLKYILFIVGLLYMIARYFAVTPCIMLEGAGVFTAFGRSAVLSRGHKLHILFTSFLAFFIFVVMYFAIAIVAAATGSLVVSTVLTVAGSILAYPLFAITEMLLYYDARVRNEGYDIEMMAEGL